MRDQFSLNMFNPKFEDKAIVMRLKNSSCEVSIDDDPKIYGYSIRLIKGMNLYGN